MKFEKNIPRITISEGKRPVTTRNVQVGNEVGLYPENDNNEIAVNVTHILDGLIYGTIKHFQSRVLEYKGFHVGQIVEFTESNVASHRV